MAVRLLPYEQQTAPRGEMQQNRVPVDVSAGMGMQAIGGALQQSAQVVEKINDDEARAEAMKAISAKEIEDAADFQSQSQAAIASPDGFGARYLQSYQKRTEKWLGQFSGRTRQLLERAVPDMQSKYGVGAIGWEFDTKKSKTAADLGVAYDNTMASVASGSIGLDEGRARARTIAEQYKQSGAADPAVAAKMDAGINRDTAWYSLQGQIQKDPDGALRRMGVNPSRSSLVGNSSAQKIFNALKDEFGSFGAAAIVGNLRAESNFDPTTLHDKDPETGEYIGVGIAGWNKERRAALRQLAASRGTTETDFDTQVDFIKQELRTTESATGDRLKNAKSAREAAEIAIGYERPRGYSSSNPRGAHQYENRVAYTEDAYGAFGGDNVGLMRSPELDGLSGDDVLRLESVARTEQKSKMAEYRAVFDEQVDNQLAMAAMGDTVPERYGLLDFLKAYPPEQAGVVYREYNARMDAGDVSAAFKSATNGEIAAAVEASRPVPGTSDYAARAKAFASVQQGAEQTLRQRSTDPAGYVQHNISSARSAWTDYANAPSDAALANAVSVTTAAQQELGIPTAEQKAVPNAVRQSMVRDIQAMPPSRAYQRLHDELPAALGGAAYWSLFRTLSTGDNALSREYQTLAQIDDPTAGVAYATALQAAKDKGQSVREAALAQMGPEEFKALQQEVASGMQDYLSTLRWQGAGSIVQQQLDAATAIAVYMPSRNGGAYDAEAAIGAITDQYDIVNNPGRYIARAPKGLGDTMQRAADFVNASLSPENLASLGAPTDRPYSDTERENDLYAMLARAQWITRPDESGWVLVKQNGRPVQYKDGSEVVLRYADAPTYLLSRANTPTTTQMAPGPDETIEDLQRQRDAR